MTVDSSDSMPASSTEVDYNGLEFNRKNIESCELIRKFDSLDGLDLFCYIRCDENSPDLVKNCRGAVFNGDNLILQSFSYTPEFNNTQRDLINNLFEKEGPFNSHLILDSYEGTLIRVFYFGERWYLSTHKRLDAFYSRWGSSKSFGAYFVEALTKEFSLNKSFSDRVKITSRDTMEKFFSLLNKENQYMFLLSSSADNRIVCDAPEIPDVFHVGTYVKFNTSFRSSSRKGEYVLDFTYDIGMTTPPKKHFKTVDEMLGYVSNVNYNKLQGVIVFVDTKDGPVQYKILNEEYQNLFKIRGNEPSIKFRYLQLRNGNPATFNKFCEMYPTHRNIFKEYEKYINDIAAFIHNCYIRRYIKKEILTINPEEYHVMKECHFWHKEDRSNNKVTLKKVLQVLDNQPAFRLNKMIKRMKMASTSTTTPPILPTPFNNRRPVVIATAPVIAYPGLRVPIRT